MPSTEEVGKNGIETQHESAVFSAERLGTPEGKLEVLRRIRSFKETDPETYRKAADLIRTHNNENDNQAALEELLSGTDLDAVAPSNEEGEQPVDLMGQRRREPRFATPETSTTFKTHEQETAAPKVQDATQAEVVEEQAEIQEKYGAPTDEGTRSEAEAVPQEQHAQTEVVAEGEGMTIERAQKLLDTLNKTLENTNTLFLIQNNGTEYSALIQEKGRAEQLVQQNTIEGLDESLEKIAQHAEKMNISFEVDPEEVNAKEEEVPETNESGEEDERDVVPDGAWPEEVPQEEGLPQEVPAVGQGAAVAQFPEKTSPVDVHEQAEVTPSFNEAATRRVAEGEGASMSERSEVPEGYVDVRDVTDIAALAKSEGVTEGTDVSAEALAERARELIEAELTKKAA